MKNTTLLILICLCLFKSAISFTLLYFSIEILLNQLIFKLFYFAFQVLGLILLVKNGTILKTIYYRYISIFIASLILSALFRVMHWPGGNLMFIISLLAIFVTYAIRFFKKEIKNQIDVMKMVSLTTFIISTSLISFHLMKKEFGLISQFFFCILLLDFSIREIRITSKR